MMKVKAFLWSTKCLDNIKMRFSFPFALQMVYNLDKVYQMTKEV